jgi:hypothetical protein
MCAVEVETMNGVSLTVPARTDFLHVVRAVVSGVGARQGLSYDEINDLCLATSEAAAYLLALPAGGRQRLTVHIRLDRSVEVTVIVDEPSPDWPPDPSRTLAWRVLSGLVSDVALVLEDSCPAIRLTMRPALSVGGPGNTSGRTEEK